MEAIDNKKIYKSIYSAKATPESVQIPDLSYLAIDGAGDPNNSPEFSSAVEALFSVSYTLKFAIKKQFEKNYVVMPLEGLWWTEHMDRFQILDKSNWLWTLLIMQPKEVTEEILMAAKEQAKTKKQNSYIDKLNLVVLEEGTSAQILHIGPYSSEAENVQKLHQFIKDRGKSFDGLIQKHHEIYLSDMRKTAPEKMKTIIRQPYI
jgi:hypothetical protein